MPSAPQSGTRHWNLRRLTGARSHGNLLSSKQAANLCADRTLATKPERIRDAERSRLAILDAAEQLFAEQGYDATSLTQVGAAAGVSRGTPGYFFRSKPELYQAVLDRSFAEASHVATLVSEAMRPAR